MHLHSTNHRSVFRYEKNHHFLNIPTLRCSTTVASTVSQILGTKRLWILSRDWQCWRFVICIPTLLCVLCVLCVLSDGCFGRHLEHSTSNNFARDRIFTSVAQTNIWPRDRPYLPRYTSSELEPIRHEPLNFWNRKFPLRLFIHASDNFTRYLFCIPV